MINTLRTIWRGSLSTWRLLLPAEVVLLQEDLAAVTTRWWQEPPLTRRLVLKFVPRLLTVTVTQRFLYMEIKARPQTTEWLWAGFYNYSCHHGANGGSKVSTCSSDETVITVTISVFVAVESSIHTSFVTRAIKIIAVHVGRYRISVSPCTSGNDWKTK